MPLFRIMVHYVADPSLPGGKPMATITLDIPDDLADQLDQVRDRLPELVALSLYQPALPAHVYRYILTFLASNPTPYDIASFGPTAEMQARLHTLLERDHAGDLTAPERAELDEYERIEHLMVMIKIGTLPYITLPV
jgi:hypothetical protein